MMKGAFNSLFEKKREQIKSLIFTKGRLIERVLYSHFFEDEDSSQCIKALKAYQNKDGGFGNGIEPDLLCPHSSAIGAETALYYIDLLGDFPKERRESLEKWVLNSVNAQGFIPHPFEEVFEYPHQKWWENPDKDRILAISGLLKKMGFQDDEFYSKVESYYDSSDPLEELALYNYPKFLYLKYSKRSPNQDKTYDKILDLFPKFRESHKSHYPIWSRYWYLIIPDLEEELVLKSAKHFLSNIDDEGGIPNPYDELPWWKPIFTLDGVILLKINGYIG
ncbi:MAG: hypothetical protein BAJALOKI2v1_70026 [Promethearchaeota archaeon]|nr:MAG: hypothetical protein BAJALOKI2v1_70026 [Candidatus Lokiarchaeota archaeon]